MKSQRLLYFLIFAILVGLSACKDDEPDFPDVTNDPSITLYASTIHTVQGRVIRLEGTVKDDVGLKSINLNNDNWYLDKTITFSTDSLIKDYDLWYDFIVPAGSPNSDDQVIITATNVGGRIYTLHVVVKMDGDFTAPTLAVSSPVDGLILPTVTPNPLDISCTISDSRRLGYFVVKEETLAFYDSISFESTATTSYDYQKTLDLPADPAAYEFAFMVADTAGNTTEKNVVVKVSADYDKMYLSDVQEEADLTTDLFGVPMLIDKIAPFTFRAKYYADHANTEIKFLPQKSSFSPHCYGVDPNNSNKLINSATEALPIVLPEKGYYQIDFNLETMEYEVAQYQPTDKPYRDYVYITDNEDEINAGLYVGTLSLVGVGWTDFQNTTGWGWDGPNANKEMTEDPENPYIWSRTEELEGTFELIFDGHHPWGWWTSPFWRFDSKTTPEKTVMNGGDNLSLLVPAKANYKITFDTHLNRAKAVRVP